MEKVLKEKKGEHPWGDTGQLIFFVLFLVVWAVDSFFLHLSTFLSDYLPLYFRLVFLAILLVVAVLLFRSAHFITSGDQRPDRVVKTGAFQYVRHPLYLASILVYFGLAVSTASFFSLAVLIGIFIFYNYISSYEEKLLEIKFGEEYLRYKQKTGKWVPRIRTKR
jgi:protein-S-isoprenylcysteine O-methyltransferase Ste14